MYDIVCMYVCVYVCAFVWHKSPAVPTSCISPVPTSRLVCLCGVIFNLA